jgi:hypothetical protein
VHSHWWKLGRCVTGMFRQSKIIVTEAMMWMVGIRISVQQEISYSPPRPHRLRGPPSLLFKAYLGLSFWSQSDQSVKLVIYLNHMTRITRLLCVLMTRYLGRSANLPLYNFLALEPFVGPWPLFQFLDQSVGLLGRGISP